MPDIHLKTGRIEYKFSIYGKYTIIKGDSATGKTTFYDVVAAYERNKNSVSNMGYKKMAAVPFHFSKGCIEELEDYILVIDEACSLLRMSNAASILQDSKNYFILISRSLKIGYLPIHVDSVLQMKASGRFHYTARLYERIPFETLEHLDAVIVEDERSGYRFLQEVAKNRHDFTMTPAYGYSKEERELKKSSASKICSTTEYEIHNGAAHVLVVYDASAFAMHMDAFLHVMKQYSDVRFYVLDWDSFEAYILNSSVYHAQILLQDLKYDFESLEQYATEQMQKYLPNYTKKRLPLCLTRKRCIQCKMGTGCHYRTYSFLDLLYGGVRTFFDYCEACKTVQDG